MSPISVVIAEDDPQIAEIQKRFLERIEGFELVGIAHRLDEAKDLLDVLKPALLLLDIRFPSGSGLELLRQMRATSSSTDVILITSAKDVESLQEALRGGVFDYILKPLVFERLNEALRNFAKHRERLDAMKSLAQDDVDSMLGRAARSAPAGEQMPQRLPKGIDGITLDKVRALFEEDGISSSAEAVGEQIGASRTTARRYLEYLVSCRELKATVNYGSVGRPERKYSRR